MFKRQQIFVNSRAILERELDGETQVLLQIRDRKGEAQRLEFPGGQINPFEPILEALAREIREETGLTVSSVLGPPHHTVSHSEKASVECLQPFFVYQTVRGPVDSVGFFFRCPAEGELTRNGDDAKEHRWIPVPELRRMFEANPETFDWLTQAAVRFYLEWHTRNPKQ